MPVRDGRQVPRANAPNVNGVRQVPRTNAPNVNGVRQVPNSNLPVLSDDTIGVLQFNQFVGLGDTGVSSGPNMRFGDFDAPPREASPSNLCQ